MLAEENSVEETEEDPRASVEVACFLFQEEKDSLTGESTMLVYTGRRKGTRGLAVIHD